MSRDADEGFAAYEDLYNRGVRLIFLKEPQINTDTYKSALTNAIPMTGTAVDFILDGVNRFLMELAKEQIKIAFEQSAKEVEDLHQRTREGLLTAKLNGRQVGQPKGAKLTTKKSIAAKETIKKHSKDFGGTLSDADVLKLTGLARNTYYKYKKEIREEI
jgi:DNA invertase Pin-like site-specific DNA recombinase